MKLILISGNAQDAISKKISLIKKNFDPLSITEISDKDTDLNLSSPSLFAPERLIILENPDLKRVEKVTSQSDDNLTVIIKFLKPLEKSSTILKKVLEKKGEITNLEEAQEISIFPFLDMLGNRNKNAFREFEKNYSQFGGQYILTMLAYFLRRLIAKPKSGSDFMRQKIESQKKNFNLEKIKSLYKEIIETDFRIKQGLVEEKMGITLLVQKILI